MGSPYRWGVSASVEAGWAAVRPCRRAGTTAGRRRRRTRAGALARLGDQREVDVAVGVEAHPLGRGDVAARGGLDLVPRVVARDPAGVGIRLQLAPVEPELRPGRSSGEAQLHLGRGRRRCRLRRGRDDLGHRRRGCGGATGAGATSATATTSTFAGARAATTKYAAAAAAATASAPAPHSRPTGRRRDATAGSRTSPPSSSALACEGVTPPSPDGLLPGDEPGRASARAPYASLDRFSGAPSTGSLLAMPSCSERRVADDSCASMIDWMRLRSVSKSLEVSSARSRRVTAGPSPRWNASRSRLNAAAVG